ncbi:hypothetical protein [Falsiroseomonas sp. E2-1-a20]|uniref:hypothetical protein n=1 Tax=Falsiroseomonas sp. E2-1-a20 TaxID=3239300 RepID=UPI003F36A5C8
MTLPADPPPPKPKLTAEVRRAHEAERLKIIRLRILIGRVLSERDLTTPTTIGAALDMPPGEALALLSRKQRRVGDLALLEAVASRLGIPDAPVSTR